MSWLNTESGTWSKLDRAYFFPPDFLIPPPTENEFLSFFSLISKTLNSKNSSQKLVSYQNTTIFLKNIC